MEKILKLSEMLKKAFPDQVTEVGVVYRSQDNEIVKSYTLYIQYEYSNMAIKTLGMLEVVIAQLIKEQNGGGNTNEN